MVVSYIFFSEGTMYKYIKSTFFEVVMEKQSMKFYEKSLT
jgi:hypothetical protein